MTSLTWPACPLKTVAGLDHEIGPAPFLGIGNLPRHYRRKPLLRHAGPRHHAGLLHRFRCRDDGHGIDTAFGARSRRAGGCRAPPGSSPRRPPRPERLARTSCTRGCTMVSSRRSTPASSKTRWRKSSRSTTPSLRGSGERLFDRRDRGPRIERVHGRVGVEHADPGLTKHGRRRRFAHADRSGQAEDYHCRSSRAKGRGASASGRSERNGDVAMRKFLTGVAERRPPALSKHAARVGAAGRGPAYERSGYSLRHAARQRRRPLLRQSRHLRDAFRGRARPSTGRCAACSACSRAW